MITAQGESCEFLLYKRIGNSAYEWDKHPSLRFLGRMANDIEKKQYRIMQGVNGGTDSVFVLSSNLPSEVKIGDKIIFLNKEWTVMSTGYYFNQSRVVNNKVMSPEKLMERCPKGLNLQ